MFHRMSITKIVEGKEEEFHQVQAEINRMLEAYGVEVLGYYYCKESNSVYCPADWGSKERLVEIARHLQKSDIFMKLYKKAHEYTEHTELHEVENYPFQYTF